MAQAGHKRRRDDKQNRRGRRRREDRDIDARQQSRCLRTDSQQTADKHKAKGKRSNVKLVVVVQSVWGWTVTMKRKVE